MKIVLENGKVLEYPDNCTKCGKSLKGIGGSPLPEKQFLCKDCFRVALSSGLENINKKINENGLELSLDEISKSFSPKVTQEKTK